MIKAINLSDISRYRSELMGLAMIFVMLFHVWMPKSNPMYGFVRCGNVGVDMFLFLSGIGLWYAWSKKPTLKNFFWRRYIRIYPAWILMACLYYIPAFINTPGGGYSRNVPDLVANILINWSFWRIDDLTFWFIPAIMMMYTFAPAYMKLIEKHPEYRWLAVAAMVLAVMVQYYPPVHKAVGHVEIFFSRIPIFSYRHQLRRARKGRTQPRRLVAVARAADFCHESGHVCGVRGVVARPFPAVP